MDKYDAAYEQGYADGLAGRAPEPPEDDTEVNYRDGYADGDFKRRQTD
jgi:ribosome modulation factor